MGPVGPKPLSSCLPLRYATVLRIGGKKSGWPSQGWRILGQMGARQRPQHGKGEADGSETGRLVPDRLDVDLGAHPNLHPRPCPIAHAQPAS